jgi:hypothetical protein
VLSRRTWDTIPVPNLVLAQVHELGKDQPEQFIFSDRKGRPIGDIEPTNLVDKYDLNNDDHVEIPGVDRGEIQTPQTPIDEIETARHDNPVINDDPGVEVDIVPNDNQELEPPLLQETTNETVAPTKIETGAPAEITGVRRSTRVKFQTKQAYIPSLSGSSKYAFAVTQLEQQGVLHPDSHMFFQQDMYRCEPDVVAAIMTQLSLKAGLKAWGKEARTAVHKEMQQLHFRDTFKPMHWYELTHTQKQSILESHMFLKKREQVRSKAEQSLAETNKEIFLVRKKLLHLQSPPSQYYSPASSRQMREEMSQRSTSQTRLFKQESRTKRTWPSSRSEGS